MEDNIYVVSDGGGAKKMPIPKKEDPFKSILEAPKPQNKPEKVPVEPEPSIVAGDATVKASKSVFDKKEESVETPKKELVYGHCNNCRLELTEDRVTKQPIEYQRNEDGSFSKTATRFSVFCKQCMKFVTLLDQAAVDMLEGMIRKIK